MISSFFGQKNWLTEHQLKVTATALGLEYNAGTRRRELFLDLFDLGQTSIYQPYLKM